MWLQEFAINFHLKLDPAGMYGSSLHCILVLNDLPSTNSGCFPLADWHSSLVGASVSYYMWTQIKFRKSLLLWSSLHIEFEAGIWGEDHRREAAQHAIFSWWPRCWLQLPAGDRAELPGHTGVCSKVPEHLKHLHFLLWILNASG